MAFEWLKGLTPEQKSEQLKEHIEGLQKEIESRRKDLSVKEKEILEAEKHLMLVEQEMLVLERDDVGSKVLGDEQPGLERIAEEAGAEGPAQENYERAETYKNTEIYERKEAEAVRPKKGTEKEEYAKTGAEKIAENYERH